MMFVRDVSWAATSPGVRRMPMPRVLPTITARPKATPRMRSRPPAGAARRGSAVGPAVISLGRAHVIPAHMEHRRLGTTGLRVSRLGLGAGNFGGIGSAPAFYGMGDSEADAFALMDRASEAGINFFDTANAYGGGRSETYIGRWLKGKGSRVRDQLLL